MEINVSKFKMDRLNTYIRIFDDILIPKNHEIFLKICKEHIDFDEEGLVVDSKGNQSVDHNARNVKTKILSNINDKSLTTVHWTSLLLNKFTNHIHRYVHEFNMQNFECSINDIQILKYEIGGHYGFHCDHGPSVPRTLSLIYFVNENYEGGDLHFRLVGSGEILKIEKKANRLIIWPSN